MSGIIRINYPLADEDIAALANQYVDHRHNRRVIRELPTRVIAETGLVLNYLPQAIPIDVAELARPALRRAGARFSNHRGYYSRMLGYDQCRMAEFTRDEIESWLQVLPFVRCVDRLFRVHERARYDIQRAVADRTAPEWLIGDTCFTTLAANLWDNHHDARTPLHKDTGDLKEGLGVICVLSQGDYAGGHLIFPKYEIAVDLQDRDLLLCDVHQFHGNAAIVGQPGWERISTIFYYQTAMQYCADKK